jgi:acetyltransferase
MNLKTFFSPRAIAVVGVSRNRKKIGSRIYANLRDGGYRGRIYPVNPHMARLDGARVYPSVSEIPAHVECAVIATPAETVSRVCDECGRARIRNVVVISAGFREIGPEGEKREQELKAILRRHSMRLLGPNCLGFLHTGSHINASFGSSILGGGGVTVISQSGAMAVALADWARTSGVRFRAMVSLGNKVGVDECDLVEHFGRDRKTTAILLYIESCERGSEFLRVARRVARNKPVILLKAGESSLGMHAAVSHTGALATPRAIFSAAMVKAGVIQIRRIEDLVDAAALLALRRRMRGNRIAIITNAGGPAIMAVDEIASSSLQLASFSPATQSKLARALPPAATTKNPIDVIGDADPERFRRAITCCVADRTVDAILVILTPQVVTRVMETARIIQRISQSYPQILFASSFLGGGAVEGARRWLQQQGVPSFSFPEDAIDALNLLARYAQNRTKPLFRTLRPVREQRVRHRGLLLPPASHRLLRRAGFSVVAERFVRTPEEAHRASRTMTFPAVCKWVSARAIHKEKSHAIWIGISSPRALQNAIAASVRRFGPPRSPAEGWLLQPYLSGGSEWFLGGKRDPSFGPVILVGRGGTEVEAAGDVFAMLPPLTRTELDAALAHACRRMAISQETVDVRAIAQSVQRLVLLFQSMPALLECDVNPLMVWAPRKGATVVDARFIFRST